MRRRVAVLVAGMLVVAGCSSVHTPRRGSIAARSTTPGSTLSSRPTPSSDPSGPSNPDSSSGNGSGTPSSTPSSTPAPYSPSAGRGVPPGVGQKIVGRERVVAYYGAPGSGALGVLGRGTPEQAAQSIIHRAAEYEHYGEPVLPAMELIATVARGSAGKDDAYSAPIPMSQVRDYLDVAHQQHMLLILDLQPGRASFLSQAQALEPVLLDPSVSLALDPEWKVGPGGRPGNGLIGHSSAAGINDATAWLSQLVRAHHLPDKLVVVHEFTASMLPDRQHIAQHPGIEMVLHADGFGHPSTKIHVLHALHFPSPPFGVGFKLFLTQDSRLMSPREVMAMHPRPDVVTYQ